MWERCCLMRGSLGYLDTKETLKEMSAKTPQQHHLLIFVQCVVHKLAAQTNGAGRIVFLDFFIFFGGLVNQVNQSQQAAFAVSPFSGLLD